jgi:uncharacterized protein (UPF0335 family)
MRHCRYAGTLRPEKRNGREVADIQQGRGSHPDLESAVDDHLKQLMQQLGNAINESLSESENIAEVIGEIKRSGYDVFLVLEATIGFNKRPGDDESATPALPRKTIPTQVSFTAQDQAFLKALRITVEE